jgi:DNA polymerase-3 subunit alpha
MGIKVLPPDVNQSVANFAAVGTDIRFGLAAIRNVGLPVVEAIIKAREEKGAFASFKDFLAKVPALVCNKRTIESLIKGGAFDSLGESRRGMVEVHERYIDALVEVKKQEAIGQDSLFGSFGDDTGGGGADAFDGLPPVPPLEWDKSTLLSFEREMLGLYVSDHPLFGIEHILAAHADTTIASLVGDEGKPDGTTVTVAGLITSLQLKRTKKGDLWAIATVEDLDGAIECLFFPSAYLTYSTMLAQDTVCAVKGRVSSRDDSISIFAQELAIPDIKEGPRGPVVLTLPLGQVNQARAERLKEILREHPGATEVQVRLTQPGRSVLMSLDDSLRVNATSALFGDLKAQFGPSVLG